MEKYLITGFSGFVSRYFLEHLDVLKAPALVLGLDSNKPEFDYQQFNYLKCQYIEIDLLESEKLMKVIHDFKPDYVLHLASYSSVAFSWKNPLASFANNTNIFLNILEQIRQLNIPCRILSIGSSEEYGNVAKEDIPIREEHALMPLSPYAVARVSQEMLSKVYVDGYGLDVVITRSFNHIGPGQRDIFVISSFAKQLVEIKKNNRSPVIHTGDLSLIRDFLDVRDVVRAYHVLLLKGKKGEIYNVCSGRGTDLATVLQTMIEIIDVNVTVKTDPSLIRPNDNTIIIGSNEKIKRVVDWNTTFTLEKSLSDIIKYWDSVI